jgi:multiple antibiotic resistance protein
MSHKFVQDAITLFVVVNPAGASLLFLALTRGMERDERLAIARRSCIIAAIILIGFIVAGEVVLDYIGVQLPAFRAAGGLVLLLVALRIVFGEEGRAPSAQPAERQDIAVFPLATPVLAGPGAIIAAVLLTENERFDIPQQTVTGVVVLGIFLLTFAALAGAQRLQQAVGTTGTLVLSRVLGLVLASLAMQTLFDGLRPFLISLR